MKLPQVHIAVNVAGLATAVGSAATWALQNQSCISGAMAPRDALAVTAIAGAVAAFLPAKPSSDETEKKTP
jgi:hypothetical protein